MKAMLLNQLGPLDECPEPLELVDLPVPEPGDDELLVRISCCGVCHTELDEIEGRAPPPRLPIVLGHEVVGTVAETGAQVNRFRAGDRVGVGWIHSSTGSADENLSPHFRATGRDVNGGYAEYLTVPQNYAYRIPANLADAAAAPLLCAGGIGFRAFRLTGIDVRQLANPRLGLMGFGTSAQIMLQFVKHHYPDICIYVFAREPNQRAFALKLGADWAGDVSDAPPHQPQAIVDTTPAWKPVIASLRHLRPGGRLVINAIRKEDADRACLQEISYHEHLWLEKEIKTVANITHHDLSEFLPLAASVPLDPKVTILPLEGANDALRMLRRGGLQGGLVLKID